MDFIDTKNIVEIVNQYNENCDFYNKLRQEYYEAKKLRDEYLTKTTQYRKEANAHNLKIIDMVQQGYDKEDLHKEFDVYIGLLEKTKEYNKVYKDYSRQTDKAWEKFNDMVNQQHKLKVKMREEYEKFPLGFT